MFGLFGGSAPKLSVDDIQHGVEDGSMVLVDCRDPMELRSTGKAKGALSVPLATMAMKCNPSSPECLPEFKNGDKTIVLYCASGARAAGAANMLRQMGHTEVQNLGGLNNWAMGGGDVVAP
ncbi:rhodanese-like domain-containing protein [Celeribacter arenosi]|uniref:Rhodanese domain-containing protein n=1 Tax=Celeribacter arenosi TaxID=792649 RepID=A0ABP7KCR1_9RHOB